MAFLKHKFTIVGFVFLAAGIAYYRFVEDSPYHFYLKQSLNEEFGTSFNEVRGRHGIPKIPSNWYTKTTSIVQVGVGFYKYTENSPWGSQIWTDWSNNEARSNEPYHKEKEIYKVFSAIRSTAEIDRYVYQVNDTTEIILELKFSFATSLDSAWSAELIKTIDSKEDYKIFSTNLSLSQADSVLNEWGLSRLK